MSLAVLLAAALSATVAGDSPTALFDAGRYADAEAAGVARNDGEGLALAARAELAQELSRAEPCLDCLKRAESLARDAIARAPDRPEAHIYLATAIGYETRIIGVMAAQAKGYGDLSHREIETALSLDRNNVWALAAAGSWNYEVVESAGTILGKMMFGADRRNAHRDYEQALAIAPGSALLHYQFALALAADDLAANRAEAGRHAEQAAAAHADTAFDRFIHDRARELSEALRHADDAAVGNLVRHDRGFPQ
jgi:tetratricopeptide (TPR) repeat protein